MKNIKTSSTNMKNVVKRDEFFKKMESMFDYKSKLSTMIDASIIQNYKDVYFYLFEKIQSGQLPSHSDYFCKNELFQIDQQPRHPPRDQKIGPSQNRSLRTHQTLRQLKIPSRRVQEIIRILPQSQIIKTTITNDEIIVHHQKRERTQQHHGRNETVNTNRRTPDNIMLINKSKKNSLNKQQQVTNYNDEKSSAINHSISVVHQIKNENSIDCNAHLINK